MALPEEREFSSQPQGPKVRNPKLKHVVPDSWDDDNDETSSPSSHPQASNGPLSSTNNLTNKEIWDAAERAAPMPTVILSSSITSNNLPPPSALGEKMRILKRPSDSPHTKSPSRINSGGGPQSLAEREAAYAVARNRIFNDTSHNTTPPASPRPSVMTSAHSETQEKPVQGGKEGSSSGVE